jgi:ribosomal protein S18 acetylase RimI-like enzyme
MIVRLARTAELAEVGELRVTAYNVEHLLDAMPSYADRLRKLGAHGDVLVAVDDDKILGTVTLERWHEASDLAAGPAEAEIRALAVAPSVQGRGIGRVLVQAVVDRAAESRVTKLWLHTQPLMVAAHRLYEQAGFVRVPERDFEPVPGMRLLAYRKSL